MPSSLAMAPAFVVGWFLAFGYLSVSAFEAVSVGLVLLFACLNVANLLRALA